MLRRLLLVLVFSQFILLVALAVLIGGYALTNATGDAAGATVLWWIAMACLMLIVVDVLLLVGVLGLYALIATERNGASHSPPDSSA
jgi:heme/copper-type cytochrome/quinol oxidase subunit 2